MEDNISVETHANIIMNRLNQLQNMQSVVMTSLFTITIGIFVATKGFDNNLTITLNGQYAFLVITGVVLFFLHLFSFYQIAAVFKCGMVLQELEKAINPNTKYYYFGGGNMRMRNRLHFISHSAPTVIMIMYPIVLYILCILNCLQLFFWVMVLVILSIYYWYSLKSSLGLNYKLEQNKS